MTERKEDYCKRYVLSMRNEAKTGKQNRMDLNKDNYSMYQLEHDFSHKIPGQSKEVLPKTRNATEQIKSNFQQSLSDLADWYRIVGTSGNDEGMLIKPAEMYKLQSFMLKRSNYFSHVGNSVQSGLLGSLSISKVMGELVPKPKFTVRKEGKGKSYSKSVVMSEDKTWELRFRDIRQENYYPDPTGGGLYEVEECEMDLHVVKMLAEGDDAIYDKAITDQLQAWSGHDMSEQTKYRETGMNVPVSGMRPRVKITEFIGDIIDESTGAMLHENCIVTLANEQHMIRPPTPNPMWHQRSHIVAAPLIEVANSVWGVAMMDAGTKHNRSLIEIFNLMLDSAIKSVWGISQIRVDMMDDPTQITDGIRWGTNIKTNSGLPIGGKVMESVVTGDVSPDVINIYNLLSQETMTSMMTNDMRMGAQSMRAVKATEVVAAENSITAVMQGMAKNFEEKKIQPELELACWTICQNWDLIDKEIFKSLFGEKRGEELAMLEPQDVFVATVNGMKFEVFGISLTLRRQADFRKWTTFLQVIAGNETLTEAFLAKYSFEKLLGEIMTALDIDKSKIESAQQPQPATEMAGAQPGGAPGASPDIASQQMSAANIPNQNPLAAAFGGQQMSMPSAQRMA